MRRPGSSLPGPSLHDAIPDVRDGLTRIERVVLYVIHETEREFPGRRVPTATIYGRVVEHVNLSVPAFERVLARLAGGSDGR